MKHIIIEPHRNWAAVSPDEALCGRHIVSIVVVGGISFAVLSVFGGSIAVENVTSLVRACALADREISSWH